MGKPRKKKAPAPAPPPAKKSRKGIGGRPKKRWLKDYASVGPPPADPLARMVWLSDILAVAMRKVIEDPGISEDTRLTRIRQLAKDLRSNVPDERRWLSEKIILDHDKKMNTPPAPAGGTGGELRDVETDDPTALSADYRELRDRGGSAARPAARGPAGPDKPDA
jgi:hypothetical protein